MNLYEALKKLEKKDPDEEVSPLDECLRGWMKNRETMPDKKYADAIIHSYRVVASVFGVELSELSEILHVVDPGIWESDLEEVEPFFRSEENWDGYVQVISVYRFGEKMVASIMEEGLSPCWSYCWMK